MVGVGNFLGRVCSIIGQFFACGFFAATFENLLVQGSAQILALYFVYFEAFTISGIIHGNSRVVSK